MTSPNSRDIKAQFKPGLDNLIAGIIIGLLLVGGGCTAAFFAVKGVVDGRGSLPVWQEKGWSWTAVALMGAIGIGLVIGGFFLIRWMRSLFSLRVSVDRDGVSVTERDTTQVFPWQDILLVRETHLYERPPILKGAAKYALPKTMSKSFVVKRKDGQDFAFNGTTIKGHTKLAAIIKEETDARQVPWEIVEEHG